jgi:hypothetical protein
MKTAYFRGRHVFPANKHTQPVLSLPSFAVALRLLITLCIRILESPSNIVSSSEPYYQDLKMYLNIAAIVSGLLTATIAAPSHNMSRRLP